TGVGRRRHRGALAAEAEGDTVVENGAVDRVVDRRSDVDVLQRGMAVADPALSAVEGELGEAALLAVDDGDAVALLEQVDRGIRNVVGDVDLTLLERSNHRIRVGE